MFAFERVSGEAGIFRSGNGRVTAGLVMGALAIAVLSLNAMARAQRLEGGESELGMVLGSPTTVLKATAGPSTPLRSAQDDTRGGIPSFPARAARNLPPRMTQAQRFLAQRGLTNQKNRTKWHAARRAGSAHLGVPMSEAATQPQAPPAATWQPLGPTAVTSANFGLVTGRVAALALDPSDTTGNHLYAGTTGGGVWVSKNAGASTVSSITFTPLTDSLGL